MLNYNHCTFVGKVKTKPQISERNGKKQAYFQFTIIDKRQDANGQWTDHPMDIEVYAREGRAKVLENHVVVGHQLLLDCKYLNWMQEGQVKHAFEAFSIGLGYSPRRNDEDEGPVPQQGPPL